MNLLPLQNVVKFLKCVPRDAWHAGVCPAGSGEGARRAWTRCAKSAPSVAPSGPVRLTFEDPKQYLEYF